MKKYTSSLCLFTLLTFAPIFLIQSYAQSCVKGILKDQVTQQPVAYALINILGKQQHTYSDNEGKFCLNLNASDTLLIRHVSYTNKIVLATDIMAEATQLIPNTVNLKEVVVTIENFNKNKKKKSKSSFSHCTDVPLKLAVKVAAAERRLRGVSVFISDKGKPEATFRIMVSDSLTTGLNFYKQALEISGSEGGEWVDVYFDEPIITKQEHYIIIEFINNERFRFESLGDNCYGISIGLSKAKNANEEVFANYSGSKDWHNLGSSFAKAGYNFMVEAILEE